MGAEPVAVANCSWGIPILSEEDCIVMVFELLLIWTGCSPDGEIPLYLCNVLNYPSYDRLVMNVDLKPFNDPDPINRWFRVSASGRCTTVTEQDVVVGVKRGRMLYPKW